MSLSSYDVRIYESTEHIFYIIEVLSNMMLCYMNGVFLDGDQAALPVSDLALQRGVAVFDSVRSYDGRPFALSAHLERLENSAALSRIPVPLSAGEIADIVREGLSRIGGDALAKIFLTGGDFEENGTFPSPRFLVLFSPVTPVPEEFYTKGIALSLLPEERELFRVKSINYMKSLTKHIPGTFEALHCAGGEITESATSSFFGVAGDNIITAPDHRVLRGVTREILIGLARKEGFNVELRCLHLDELPDITEAFITGSVKEVTPVTRIGDLVIGDGLPGTVTVRMLALFRQNIPLFLE